MLEIQSLSKSYGPKTAVNNISFTVPDGKVTGFLGPNGAGKSTTMRMIVGLEKPTSGKALVDGKTYSSLSSPLSSVGVLLDAKAMHPGRSGLNHLRSLALTHGIPKKRVDEVIEMTGLTAVAKKKVKGFSLGMGQRMGIAAALLGDPQNVILDEPVNGLDPEGVIWVRNLARYLASEGKTVLISSHLMSEMAQTADDLVVIGQGRLLANSSMKEFLALADNDRILVRTDDREALDQELRNNGISVSAVDTDALMVQGLDARSLARLAQDSHVLLHEITPQIATLEDVYMNMTRDQVEYNSSQLGNINPAAAPSSTPQAQGATMYEESAQTASQEAQISSEPEHSTGAHFAQPHESSAPWQSSGSRAVDNDFTNQQGEN
ncbi:MAG: ABC transporter ATP-binding protein [Rothia sp. (in: high G+C Gram-positive bacteria)]|nr:ABC transporter ATP-binding protein [Rothia sp. (in: high G+C Gram-positive bacteria)]